MIGEAWLKMLSGVALVLVFGAGLIVGAGLMRHQQRTTPPALVDGATSAIEEHLALDDVQRALLRQIRSRHEPAVRAISREVQPKLRAILFAIEDELRPSLTAAQINALERWRQTRRAPHGGEP